MADLTALALRCEQETGNTDDLSRAIHEIDPRSNVNGSCRDYAGSIDGATTLVPSSCSYSINTETSATVYLRGSKKRKRWHGTANRPALALCAAALRALGELETRR